MSCRHFCSRETSCVRCSSSTAARLNKHACHSRDGRTRYSQYCSGPMSSQLTFCRQSRHCLLICWHPLSIHIETPNTNLRRGGMHA